MTPTTPSPPPLRTAILMSFFLAGSQSTLLSSKEPCANRANVMINGNCKLIIYAYEKEKINRSNY